MWAPLSARWVSAGAREEARPGEPQYVAGGRERAGTGVGRKRGNGLEPPRLGSSAATTRPPGMVHGWRCVVIGRSTLKNHCTPAVRIQDTTQTIPLSARYSKYLYSFCSLRWRRVTSLHFRQGNWAAQWIRGEARRAGRFKLSLKTLIISTVRRMPWRDGACLSPRSSCSARRRRGVVAGAATTWRRLRGAGSKSAGQRGRAKYVAPPH